MQRGHGSKQYYDCEFHAGPYHYSTTNNVDGSTVSAGETDNEANKFSCGGLLREGVMCRPVDSEIVAETETNTNEITSTDKVSEYSLRLLDIVQVQFCSCILLI